MEVEFREPFVNELDHLFLKSDLSPDLELKFGCHHRFGTAGHIPNHFPGLIPQAAAIQGRDPRHYLVQTKRFLKDAAGKLTGLEIVEIEWAKDEQGRFSPQDIPGTLRVIPCQLALLAMGFTGPENEVIQKFALDTDARSNIKAEHGSFTTNVPGVFAAGDVRRGQSLVVWAINEGRGAARECDRFLMGATNLP